MEDLYSIRNGTTKTHIFLADSSMRNAEMHPSPSEYSIFFDTPFRNVVGFELLKASIPRTEYTLDSNSNVLTYSLDVPRNINTWSSDVGGNIRIARFSTGDYNLPQLIRHMNDVLAQVANAANDPAAITVVPTTNPPEISNRIRLECPEPFCILGNASTCRQVLGFGNPVSSSPSGYATVQGWTTNITKGASYTFCSVPDNNSLSAEAYPESLLPTKVSLEPNDYRDTSTSPQFEFYALCQGNPASVTAYMTIVDDSGGITYPTVSATITDTLTSDVIASGSAVVTKGTEGPAGYSLTIPLTATSNFVYGKSYTITFENLTAPENTTVGVSFNEDEGYACLSITTSQSGYSVTAPGIVNLFGSRYIKIRCPEIEQHLFGERSGDVTTPGIGLVELTGDGYQRQNFNFVHYPPLRFNPIGKLGSLTFRLQRPDGALYDAQGVNNSVLCAITYGGFPQPSAPKSFPAAPSYSLDPLELERRALRDEISVEDAARSSLGRGRRLSIVRKN
jgi:hypothetical protein